MDSVGDWLLVHRAASVIPVVTAVPVVPVVFAIVTIDLASDLTSAEFRAVNVHIRLSRADECDDFRELSRCRGRGPGDAVRSQALNVGRRERPGDSPLTGVERIDSTRGRQVARSRILLGITQPEDDASRVLWKTDVDVRLLTSPSRSLNVRT